MNQEKQTFDNGVNKILKKMHIPKHIYKESYDRYRDDVYFQHKHPPAHEV